MANPKQEGVKGNKKGSDATQQEDLKKPEGLGIRIAAFGLASLVLSWYLYEWADTIRLASQNRAVWPPEYQNFMTPDEVHASLLKFPYSLHMEILKVVGLGTLHILVYSIFYCDLLTISLPQRFSSLDTFPFVVGLVDFVENVLYFITLIAFPEPSPASQIVGYVTGTKTVLSWAMYFIMGASLFTLPFRSLYADLSASKKKEQ